MGGAAIAQDVSSKTAVNSGLLLTVIIASAPLILAVMTWDHSQANQIQLVMRELSFPVAMIEIAVFALALRQGLSLEGTIRSWPGLVRAAVFFVASTALLSEFILPLSNPYTVERTSLYVVHVLFGVSTWHLLTQTRVSSEVFWASLLAGILIYIALLALYVATISDETDFNWLNFGLGVTHVRHLGVFSTVGTAIAWGLMAKSANRFPKWYFFAAIICLALSFWSGTRGSLFALAGSLVAGLFLIPCSRRKIWLLLISATIPIAALSSLAHRPPVPYYGLSRIVHSTDVAEDLGTISSNRTDIWRESVKLIIDHPIAGIGESRFRQVAQHSKGFYNHPHNFALQYLLQWGIPAGLAFISIMGWLYFIAYQRARKLGEDALPPALVIVGLTALASIDGTFYYPYPLTVLAISLAFLFAKSAENPDRQIRPPQEPIYGPEANSFRQ